VQKHGRISMRNITEAPAPADRIIMPLNEKECPHCDEILSRQAYYRHRLLYFRNGIWKKKISKLIYVLICVAS